MILWIALVQVLVTLVVVPLMSLKRFETQARQYLTDQAIANGDCESITQLVKKTKTRYLMSVTILLFFALGIVAHAMFYQVELLAWDNQSGLIVLCLMAVIPVFMVGRFQYQFLAIIKAKLKGIRTASLASKPLLGMIPSIAIFTLIGAHLIYVYTVYYFNQHPFDGFAGYYNLLGALVIDGIFLFAMRSIYLNKKLNAIQDPEQRISLKTRSINISLAAWNLALLYLSLSLWINGLNQDLLSLLVQSIYLQISIVVAAFVFRMPRSIN